LARQTIVEYTCETCATKFTRRRWEMRRSKGAFCSRKCANQRSRSTPEKFWARVNKTDGCWLWTAGKFKAGYGLFGNPPTGTHRLSWEMHYGPIPVGKYVCHDCDKNYPPGDITYRRCVRPDHLFLGSQADNMADCAAKGRSCKGERQGRAKLTDAKVRQARLMRAEGMTYQAIADQLGVHSGDTISAVCRGVTWGHVS
jgi:hypothetical protein